MQRTTLLVCILILSYALQPVTASASFVDDVFGSIDSHLINPLSNLFVPLFMPAESQPAALHEVKIIKSEAPATPGQSTPQTAVPTTSPVIIHTSGLSEIEVSALIHTSLAALPLGATVQNITNTYVRGGGTEGVADALGRSMTEVNARIDSLAANPSGTLSTLTVTGSATSTFAGGIDIAGGCFSIDGVCLSGSSGLSFGKSWELNSFGALAPTTTVGIMVNASSTIGNGTQTGGLTVAGGATTTGNVTIGSTFSSFNSTTKQVSVTGLASQSGAVMTLNRATGNDSTLDIVGTAFNGNSMRIFISGSAEPVVYINDGGHHYARTSLTVSGHYTGSVIDNPSSDPYMIGCWADVGTCMQLRTNTASDDNITMLDSTGNYRLGVNNAGTILFGSGNRAAMTNGLSLNGAKTWEFNNGTPGQVYGTLVKVGKVTIQDATPSTGTSLLSVLLGPADSVDTTLLDVRGGARIDGSLFLGSAAGVNGNWQLSGTQVNYRSETVFRMSNNDTANGTKDLGWARNGAGVLEINNGTAGTLRDLVARNIGVSTTSPWRTLSVNGTVATPGLVNDSTGYYACVNTTTGQLSTSTSACGASSLKFKENIKPLSYGLTAVQISRVPSSGALIGLDKRVLRACVGDEVARKPSLCV